MNTTDTDFGRSTPGGGDGFPGDEDARRSLTPDQMQDAMKAPILLQYFQLVLRWKWVILSIMALSVVAGVVITLMMTPQYTASSRLEISREQKRITNVQGVDAESASRDLEFYQTQYSLLEARSLAQRVARAEKLATNRQFFEAHGIDPAKGMIAQARNAPLSARELQRRQDLATNLLLGHIQIAPVRGSALVDVRYTSATPVISAMVANAWVGQFIQSSMDRRFGSTADARKFLESRLASLRERLQKSERDLVDYANDKQIVNLSTVEGADGKTRTDRTLLAQDLDALNTALAQATAQRVAAESRGQTASGAGSSTQALNNQAIALLRQQRAQVAAEYSKTLTQFEPAYPAARALKNQLDTLDAGIAREETRVRSTISSEYREALQQEQGLRDRVDALKQQFREQQSDSIQYNIYQREADTNRQLYEALLQRYKEIGVAAVGASNIAIVDEAQVPTGPSAPSLPLNVALAILAGLVLSAAATLALDEIDEGLREPGQVGPQLEVPLLGAIPDQGDRDVRAELRDVKSEIGEAYLTVRSNLAFSTDHGVPRSFMVTSTRPAEGKSTSSLALGTLLGRTGKSVLLIDADMRRPSLHGAFGVKNTQGLSNLLAGDETWRESLHRGLSDNVDFLSAGPIPPSAAELLSSDRLVQLVKEFLQSYDHVVIDSPPLLGIADAPLISRAVEGTLFVVESEGVPVRGLRSALNRIRSGQRPIFGAILTKLKNRHAAYGYGYGYGYGYKYGKDDA